MRVVFFLQGENVPAARARGLAVARALERHGIRCELRIPHPSVYGDTGLPAPWRRLRPLYALGAPVSRMRQLGGLAVDDIVFFQRPMVELPTVVLERLAARGRRSIFDFDDAIFRAAFGASKLRALVRMADQVIAGNRHLAAAADAPDKTTVIPTAVDTDRYALLPTPPTKGRDVIMGWTGIAGNYPQLATARSALKRVIARTGARLLIISDAPPPPKLADLDPIFIPWRAETEIQDLGRIDIGLMPLPDDPRARGKCAWKLIQYMALGRPGVASPVGANVEVVTDGVDGFLPADEQGWADALERLIRDPDLRKTTGQRGRDRVEAAYSLKAVTPLYLQVLGKISSAPP